MTSSKEWQLQLKRIVRQLPLYSAPYSGDSSDSLTTYGVVVGDDGFMICGFYQIWWTAFSISSSVRWYANAGFLRESAGQASECAVFVRDANRPAGGFPACVRASAVVQP